MWESRLSGSARGWGATRTMGEILWHRRETRRQTEKTNLTLKPGESPVYSKNPTVRDERGACGNVMQGLMAVCHEIGNDGYIGSR